MSKQNTQPPGPMSVQPDQITFESMPDGGVVVAAYYMHSRLFQAAFSSTSGARKVGADLLFKWFDKPKAGGEIKLAGSATPRELVMANHDGWGVST